MPIAKKHSLKQSGKSKSLCPQSRCDQHAHHVLMSQSPPTVSYYLFHFTDYENWGLDRSSWLPKIMPLVNGHVMMWNLVPQVPFMLLRKNTPPVLGTTGTGGVQPWTGQSCPGRWFLWARLHSWSELWFLLKLPSLVRFLAPVTQPYLNAQVMGYTELVCLGQTGVVILILEDPSILPSYYYPKDLPWEENMIK